MTSSLPYSLKSRPTALSNSQLVTRLQNVTKSNNARRQRQRYRHSSLLRHLTTMVNHMRYGITQCYPVTFPPLPQQKLVLDLATPEGCKTELIWVVVISQDSLPAEGGHLSYLRNNRVVSWLGIEPTTKSPKSNILTIRLPGHRETKKQEHRAGK